MSAAIDIEYDQKLNALRQARDQAIAAENAQTGDVNNAYNSSINALNEEKASTLPKFQQQRDNAWVSEAQNKRGLNESMAAKGLFNGGDNITGETALKVARENAVSTANSGENQFMTSFNNRKSEVENTRANALKKIADAIALANTQEAQNEQALNDWRAGALRDEQEKLAAEDRSFQRQLSLRQASQQASGFDPTEVRADYINHVLESRRSKNDAIAQIQRDENYLRQLGLGEQDIRELSNAAANWKGSNYNRWTNPLADFWKDYNSSWEYQGGAPSAAGAGGLAGRIR